MKTSTPALSRFLGTVCLTFAALGGLWTSYYAKNEAKSLPGVVIGVPPIDWSKVPPEEKDKKIERNIEAIIWNNTEELKQEIRRKNFIESISGSLILTTFTVIGSLLLCLAAFQDWIIKRKETNNN